MTLPEKGERRGQGSRTPTRFNGSVALTVTVHLVRLAADSPERLHRLRQRKLFTHQAGHKAATADLTLRLKATVDDEQLSPCRRAAFGTQTRGLTLPRRPLVSCTRIE